MKISNNIFLTVNVEFFCRYRNKLDKLQQKII